MLGVRNKTTEISDKILLPEELNNALLICEDSVPAATRVASGAAASVDSDLSSLSRQLSSIELDFSNILCDLLKERVKNQNLLHFSNVTTFVRLSNYLEDTLHFWKPLEGCNPSDQVEEDHILKFLAQAKDCSFESLFAETSGLQKNVQRLLHSLDAAKKSTEIVKIRDEALNAALRLAKLFVQDFGDIKERYGLAFFNNTRKQKVIFSLFKEKRF